MSWRIQKLGELCEINMGKTPSRNNPTYWNGDNPWVSISDLKGDRYISNTREGISDKGVSESGIKPVEKETLLYSFKLSIGKVAITKSRIYTNEAIVALPIKEKNKLDLNYLYWAVQNINLDGIGDKAVKGITLNKEKLKELPIPLPPFPIQLRIAEILDKADALRRNDQELLLKYDELAQAIFIDMFGDPVRNEKGWEVRPLFEKINSIRYGTGSPPKYSPNGIPFIRATNIKKGNIVKKDMVYVSESDARAIQKCFVNEGDLIVVRSGVNTGDCGLITKEYNRALAGYDLIIEMDHEYSRFYHYYINSKWGQDIIRPLSRRAAQPHLNSDQVNGLMLICPPKAIVAKFNTALINIASAKSNLEDLGRLNTDLFDSLLQRSFSGELVA